MVARQWLGNLKGPKGDTGTIEAVTATADATHLEEPTVDVVLSGEPSSRSMEFQFHGLRGYKGDTGTIEAVTATVDNEHSEEPTVNVDLTGDPSNRSMEFQFHGIMGPTGPIGPKGDPAKFSTIDATVDDQVGTPEVNVTYDGPEGEKAVHFEFKNMKGEKGDQGDRGPEGPQGQQGVQGEPGKPEVDQNVKYDIAKFVYPIGSYYWSSNRQSPEFITGPGTSWTPVENRFVYAASQGSGVGEMGGNNKITLTESQLPMHSHTLTGTATGQLPSHRHGLNSHTHSLNNHSHSMQHNHTINALPGGNLIGVNLHSYVVKVSSGIAGGLNFQSFGATVMPSISQYTGNTGTANGNTGAASGNTADAGGQQISMSLSGSTSTDSSGGQTGMAGGGSTGTVGIGAEIDIRPQYITAYCWRRTA